MLLPLLCFAPPAHANTYRYSFTTAQLLTALTSEADYSGDGYYAVLLQPTTLTGYTIARVNSPDPADGAADWQATTDSADPFAGGTWVEFAKGNTQTTSSSPPIPRDNGEADASRPAPHLFPAP